MSKDGLKQLNISLRIAISDKCNFACLYCPKCMEDYCPEESRTDVLSTEDFVSVLSLILGKYRFNKIIITGGEPMLSSNLIPILQFLKKFDTYIELDTNGSLFTDDIWSDTSDYINGVKVSLDSLNASIFNFVTNNTNPRAIDNIKKLISASQINGTPVTLNIVYTRINQQFVMDVISFAIDNNLNVTVLDLYWSKDTNEFWSDNYIDISYLVKKFAEIFGDGIDDVFTYGCDFKVFYYNNDNYIKIKTSSTKTMRDGQCELCSTYCQEGIFSFRLSCQGYATVCQSNERYGVLLDPNSTIDCIDNLVDRLQHAVPDNNSFEKMLRMNGIKLISSEP